MGVSTLRTDGSAVTCPELFPDSTAVGRYNSTYVEYFALSLQIPALAVTLQNITCGGAAVPSAGFDSSGSASVHAFDVQDGVLPLLMVQKLRLAPKPVLMADVSALQSTLGSKLSTLLNVNASVTPIVDATDQPITQGERLIQPGPMLVG